MHSDCGVAGMLQCISVALKISTDISEAERMHVSSLKSLEKGEITQEERNITDMVYPSKHLICKERKM